MHIISVSHFAPFLQKHGSVISGSWQYFSQGSYLYTRKRGTVCTTLVWCVRFCMLAMSRRLHSVILPSYKKGVGEAFLFNWHWSSCSMAIVYWWLRCLHAYGNVAHYFWKYHSALLLCSSPPYQGYHTLDRHRVLCQGRIDLLGGTCSTHAALRKKILTKTLSLTAPNPWKTC